MSRLPTFLKPRPDRWAWTGLALWQGLWAWWYHRLGAEFAGLGSPFTASLWQLLPASWLQGREALASLWLLHGQPPLFNALYALFLNLPGPLELRNALLAFVVQALSWLTLGLLYAILRRLGLAPLDALAWTLLWSLYPAFAGTLYVFSYTLWVIGLLTLLLWASLQPRPWGPRLFWGAATALALLRATYGLPFLTLLWLWDRIRHRRVGAWSTPRHWVPALLVVFLWTLKNGLLFGVWTSSSWFGMNWARNYLTPFSEETLREGITRYGWPDILLYRPFAPIERYPTAYWQALAGECSGPPALCSPTRPDGEANFNFIGYIPVSRAYVKGGMLLWRRHYLDLRYFLRRMVLDLYFSPAYYATSMPGALLHFWQPLMRTLDTWTCPHTTFEGPGRPPLSWNRYLCPRLMALYGGLMMLGGLWLLLLAWRKPPAYGPGSPRFWTLVLALGTWGYASLVYTLFEFGENPRFRLEVDLFAWVLAGVLLYRAVPRLLFKGNNRGQE